MRQDAESIIRERWPLLYRKLVSEIAEPIHFSATPLPAPVFRGLRLCSGYDRNREACMQATLIPETTIEATMYGFVSEDLPQALLARNGLRRLNIILLHLPLAHALIRGIADTSWLADPRVVLIYGGEEQAVRFPFTVVPPCLQFAEAAAGRVRDLVRLELSTLYLNQQFARREEELGAKINRNMSFIQQDNDVKALFGLANNDMTLVAAAGPTLSNTLPVLSQLHRNHPLIAVDAALPVLLKHDIVPDCVVTIDPHAAVRSLFASSGDNRLRNSKLIYFPVVDTEILSSWKGERYTAYSTGPLYTEEKKLPPKGTLFSAGSVLHPAVDLAVQMGAPAILLFGADFSYPGGMTHAEGCYLRQNAGLEKNCRGVINGNGQPVASRSNLIGYLRDLEEYIIRHPFVRFMNTSKEGAKILGTTYYPDE